MSQSSQLFFILSRISSKLKAVFPYSSKRAKAVLRPCTPSLISEKITFTWESYCKSTRKHLFLQKALIFKWYKMLPNYNKRIYYYFLLFVHVRVSKITLFFRTKVEYSIRYIIPNLFWTNFGIVIKAT